MTSPYDEFISNFDLAHLTSEEPVQIPEPNFDKQRKSTLLLKTKIISTDFLIQDYMNKTENYNQMVRAHTVTKEDLKETCINLKNMTEKCTLLEKEQKELLEKNEDFQKKALDFENKYSALISYTNQLQSLVKDLEIKKDALIVEKQLEKDDSKLVALQKEKDAMLKDIMIMKDIVLGKKKRSKRYTNLLKKYANKTDSSMFDGTSDELDSEDDTLAHAKVHKPANNNLITNLEQNFIDDNNSLDSDCSNEGVSEDTGRGSSRATSDEKCLNSPDYFIPISSQKIAHRDEIKQVDVANSPITVYESVSVATSPVGFDQPLFEDLFDDRVRCNNRCCINSFDYFSNYEMEPTNKQNELIEASTSPIHESIELRRYVDIGTSPIAYDKQDYSTIDSNKSFGKSLFIDTEGIHEFNQQSCIEESDILKNKQDKCLIDACTSPIKNAHNNEMIEQKKQVQLCEKSTFTETVSIAEKKIVDSCTSPVFKTPELRPLIDKGTSPLPDERVSRGQDKKSVKKCLFNDREEIKEQSIIIEEQIYEKGIYNTIGDKMSVRSEKQQLESDEKICLESHSSNSLRYEKSNDIEIQDILNVMQLHFDLISPIPKTPSKIQSNEHVLKMINNSLISVQKSLKELDDKFHSIEGQVGDMKNQCNNVKENVVVIQNIIKGDILKDYVEVTNVNIDKNDTQQQHEIVNIGVKEVSVDSINNTVVIQDTCATASVLTSNKEADFTKINEVTESFSNILTPSITPYDKDKVDTNKKIILQHQLLSDHEIFEEDTIDATEINDTSTEFVTNDDFEAKIPTETIENACVIKRKKLSKLEKLRNKLKPTNKIKKVISPITKHVAKPRYTVSTNSSSELKHKIAYEKAVKVMTEQRLNEASQGKLKVPASHVVDNGTLKRKLNKVETSTIHELFDCKAISTRSRTRSLSKKNTDDSVFSTPEKRLISEDNTSDVEKTVRKRKSRKRTADDDLDNLQSSCKRVLRSSNVSPISNNITLRIVDTIAESLHDDESRDSEESENKKISIVTNNTDSILKNGNQSSNSNNHNQCINTSVVTKSVLEGFVNSTEGYTGPCYSTVGEIQGKQNISVVNQSNVDLSNSLELNQGKLVDDSHTNTERRANIDLDSKTQTLVENGETATNAMKDICSVGNNVNSNRNNDNNKLDKIPDEATLLRQKLRELGCTKKPVVELTPLGKDVINHSNNHSYSDLDLFTSETNLEDKQQKDFVRDTKSLKDNILCNALERYGVISIKYYAKKVPEDITNNICQEIDKSITSIIASKTDDQKKKMNDLVVFLRNFKTKYILSGLMKYLKDPTRKFELNGKVKSGLAPPMTKPEVILLFVIENLNQLLPSGKFIHRLWNNIEHALFQLNHSPHFDVIESMSHFYAVMCRYFRNKSRLRCFMLDAMYCLQFKAIPLITQCLEVCPKVLPNAHEHLAKTSLVTCLVYLLHFYKCEDKLQRAQDIRNTLNRKYAYQFSEWNENVILEIFRKAIMNLRGVHHDKKMLRIALIILCKRHGAKWCQTNIIQNMLLPILEKQDTPEKIKQFCILMLGPLLKPFPADRKAQCEIVINQLLQLLKQNVSNDMKETIYSSLIFMQKHDEERIVQALLLWNPEKVSTEFEEILNDFIMAKPLSIWKKLISRRPAACS